MSAQYENLNTKLKKHDIVLLTTFKEFMNDKKSYRYPTVDLMCKNNHYYAMTELSITTKLQKFEKGAIKYICRECEKKYVMPKMEKRAREICDRLNFEFIKYNRDSRYVTFKCSCGNTVSTNIKCLTVPTKAPNCSKCINQRTRKSYAEVAQIFKDYNCELLETEYKSVNTPMRYKCRCGEISSIRYNDFVRGIRCKNCYLSRFRLELAGVVAKDFTIIDHCEILKHYHSNIVKYLSDHGVEYVTGYTTVLQRITENCKRKYPDQPFMRKKYIEQYYTIMMEPVKKGVNLGKRLESSLVRKKYTSIAETSAWMVFGYESRCIRHLLYNLKIPETDILICNDVDSEWFSDIYLPLENKLIQVKSECVYKMIRTEIIAKMKRCPTQCQTWIFNRDHKLVKIINGNKKL